MMLTPPKNTLRLPKAADTRTRPWFVFLDPGDQICERFDIPESSKIRVVANKNIPLFSLFYASEKHGYVTARELLYALGDNHLEFPTQADRVAFMEILQKNLETQDQVSATAKKSAIIGSAVLGVVAFSAGALFVMYQTIKRSKK